MGKYYQSTPWLIPETPSELKQFLMDYGERKTFKKGDVVAGPLLNTSSHNLDHLIFLESGLLSQCYVTHNINKPHAISIVLPNRMVNYCGFMGIDISEENVISLRNSIIYKLPIKRAHELLEKNQELQYCLQQYSVSCIASDYDGFTCMFTCETEKRLAFFFKSLATSFNNSLTDEWSIIPVKLSYSELSAVMYTTQKTIERIIPEWKLKGLIFVNENGFKVNNKAMVNFTKS